MRSMLRFWFLTGVAAVLLSGGTAPAKPGKAQIRENEAAEDALFTNAVVLRVQLEISAAAADSLRKRPHKYVPATLREGGRLYSNVLVHLKGSVGSMRQLDDKPGLTVKLGDTNAPFHGLKKFHLNNSVQDRTYLSEWICGEMFREAGVPATRASHALVELNGRRLGLYVLLESINKPFLAQYFKNTHGNVYGQSGNADVNMPLHIMGGRSDTNRTDLRRLAAAVRDPDRDRLARVLDVERFISFMAMETMLSHWDGYTFSAHNYRVFHDLDADKMVFIPHDMDQMMRRPLEGVVPKSQGMVSAAILRVPETRKRYQERFAELCTNVFLTPDWGRRIDELTAKVAPALEEYDPDMARVFRTNAHNMKIRINRRARVLDSLFHVTPPERIEFFKDGTPLKGWRLVNDQKGADLARVKTSDEKSALWIEAHGPTASSWRLRVALKPGTYVFEGMARSEDIKPLRDAGKGVGAGLRVPGPQRPPLNKLTGDSSWKQLVCEFQIAGNGEEIELVCELRASEGAVWFDEDSLRLRRL